MFCNKPKNVNRTIPTKRNRKRRKKATYPQDNKKPKQAVQNNSNLALAMSSWAETYTAAATWQLKHQIAYWKSRAKSLEYENKVLHDVIRKNYFKGSAPQTCDAAETSESSEDIEEESQGTEEDEDDDVEVSEEFIEFLKKNAKHREDVRRERERYKASTEENGEECMEEEIVEGSEEKKARFKELYGSHWEKIMALETFVLCEYIHEKDKERPQYWPNIPFNFDY